MEYFYTLTNNYFIVDHTNLYNIRLTCNIFFSF